MPSTDTYIEKDSSINDEIERLRHSATSALEVGPYQRTRSCSPSAYPLLIRAARLAGQEAMR